MMDFASEIKNRLDTKEVFEYYGLRPNRSGFVCCFSHNERTPSMKVYRGDGGFHCFSCGAHGSVIDFVMKYFGIPFWEAIKKINEDFSLGLPIGEKLDRRKQLEMQKQTFLRKREMNAREKEKKELEDAYWSAFDRWKYFDDNMRKYAPKDLSGDFHPLFIEALENIHQSAYVFQNAEYRRMDYEKRSSYNP